MSAPGRPAGEFRSARQEGRPVSAAPDAIADEARRQAALLALIDGGEALPAALPLAGTALAIDAWRANALALADKALRPVFPTLCRMLGDTDFARLAREFRAAHPPACGDLGEWGRELPAFIEAHVGLRAWPWLGDTARLDLALHHCERAFDGVVDLASLGLLQTAPPTQVRLVLAPGTAVLESAWPLAAIHDAHRRAGADADADDAFTGLRRAIEARAGESVMIVRDGWRAAAHRLDAAGVRWVESLLAGHTLAASLDHAGVGFDLVAWLARAVKRSWLEGALRIDASERAPCAAAEKGIAA